MPFCSRCGEVLEVDDRFCPNCGTPVETRSEDGPLFEEDTESDFRSPSDPVYLYEKSCLTAAVLSFILPGLGHMYVSRFWGGVRILLFCLFIDFMLIMLAPEAIDPVTLESYYDFEAMTSVYLIVRFIYSVYFAALSYRLARRYNSELEETGSCPW